MDTAQDQQVVDDDILLSPLFMSMIKVTVLPVTLVAVWRRHPLLLTEVTSKAGAGG